MICAHNQTLSYHARRILPSNALAVVIASRLKKLCDSIIILLIDQWAVSVFLFRCDDVCFLIAFL